MPDEDDQGTGAPANGQEPGAVANELAKLRKENATWRRKFRDAEIGTELAKRGVQADPSWVKVSEGEEVSTAVEAFMTQYPFLAGGAAEVIEEPTHRATAPAALAPQPKRVNNPGPPPVGQHRNLDEVKKDPKARKQLVEQYRSLLGHNE